MADAMTSTRSFALLIGAVALAGSSCGTESPDSVGQELPSPAPSTTAPTDDRSPEPAPSTTVPSNRVAAPVTTAAVPDIDRAPVDLPVALNTNDPSTPLGGLCWAFTETLLVSAAESVNTAGFGESKSVERLEQAAQLITAERTEALDPELRAFSSDLAVIISNVDTAIQDSQPGAERSTAVAESASLESLSNVDAFEKAALSDKACAGVQQLSSIEPR